MWPVLRIEWPSETALELLAEHGIGHSMIGDALCLHFDDGRDVTVMPGAFVEVEL